jgi:hypothetical protein
MSKPADILELLRDLILASSGELDLSDTDKCVFSSAEFSPHEFTNAEIPRVEVYAPFPRANTDNTSNTESSLDIMIGVYYRAGDDCSTLEQSQTDHDIAEQMRAIVHAIQQAQVDGTTAIDAWLISSIEQNISRPITGATENGNQPILKVTTSFTLSFEEDL